MMQPGRISVVLLALLLSCSYSAASPRSQQLPRHSLVAAVDEAISGSDASSEEGGKSAVSGWIQNLQKKPILSPKPLIGILSQACHRCPGKSYVAAAYVKWIEAAGGRAVPIRYYASDKELKRLFNSVNGLIFPGGLTDLYMDDPYVVAAKKLHQWAADANDAGEVMPIQGTCLGHQLLQILATWPANFTEILVPTDSVAQAGTLEFTADAASSYYMGELDPALKAKASDPKYNLIIENHEFGMPVEHYESWPVLKEHYKILSTSKDRNGLEYVSTIESRHHPFFGTQWHPEKPPYEFAMEAIPHSIESIKLSQHLGHAFIDAARRSSHAPESEEEELEMQIYNVAPVFTAKDVVMEPSYDGPDITYFLDDVHVQDDGKNTGFFAAPKVKSMLGTHN